MMDHITAYPLTWPDGWKRTSTKKRSQFSRKRSGSYGARDNVTIAQATIFVLEELRRMGIGDWNVIISSQLKLRNDGLPYSSQRTPDDVGISVWWKDGKQQRVIALDQYDRIADNLYAIGKTIEAMRGIDRWGGGEILERTFSGFTALPNPAADDWRKILSVDGTALGEEITDNYKRLRGVHHPDKGGSEEKFIQIQDAYNQARKELGF